MERPRSFRAALTVFSATVTLSLLWAIFVPGTPRASAANLNWTYAGNAKNTILITDKGTLARSVDSVTEPSEVPLAGQRNDISNVLWDGKYFVASTYFGLYYSANGNDWSFLSLPTGGYFKPGNIISDAEFFDHDAMSETEIQRFLDSKVPECRAGYVCLKDFRGKTTSKAKSAMCDAFTSKGVERASAIISRVASACGISPQVLIVLLQKEQGLVTHTWPSSWRFDKATGYACPDTAPCDTEYYGFFNQVYNAAKQFKRYANPPGTSRFFTWHAVGSASAVRYHPNSACGSQSVFIENQATANLYYYTPYQPNSNSLTAYSGIGDSCSSYGNRNFWRYYNVWFARNKDFQNWPITSKGKGVVVDQDGVTFSVDLAQGTWSPGQSVPGTASRKVTGVGKTQSGTFAAVRSDGKQFALVSLSSWVEQRAEDLSNPGVSSFESAPTPSISGEPVIGEVLTAVPGAWNPTPRQLTYQWFRGANAVSGATSATYLLGEKDVGNTLSVTVTGSLEGYRSTTTNSSPTELVTRGRSFDNVVLPRIVGLAQVGNTLEVEVDPWTPSAEGLTYQWLRNGKPIRGATSETYLVTAKDQRKRIQVTVTGTREGYAPTSATSEPSWPVTRLKSP